MMETDTNSDSETLMTPAEVARQFGVTPVTVRTWVTKGWLKSSLTPGGHRRFARQDVKQLLSERSRQHNGQEPLRLLVVDDEQAFRQYIVDAIANLLPEAEILEAADCFQAGVAIEKYRPDLVFLDHSMPGMNGTEVCRLIKQDGGYASTRVVAFTGAPEDRLRAALLEAGADEVLNKPVYLHTLKGVMSQFEVLASA